MGGFNAVGEDLRQQSKWDMPVVEYDKDFLINSTADSRNKARLLAVMSTHSGDWLHAAPLTAAGLRMDDAVVRVAASLWLGTLICAAHICQCGSSVDTSGTHGPSRSASAGRISRHSSLNDIIHRALIRAQVN